MQKITLKYDLVSNYAAPRNYTMEFDLSEMTFDEFLAELRKFAILVGYKPEAVEDAFPQD